jgi:2-keto-4-pentenoate hydratase/2-oxohepta-3-ene-1,7-dioic acid hydratase in catechol pathway
MKIICIGRNYVDHIHELQNAIPEDPVIFQKPDTALLKEGAAFYLPDFSQDVHHEVEIVVKISKMGKNIDQNFAHKYYDQVGIGIDFTARDLQSKLKTKGLPWELAKAFDGSAPISDFVPKTEFVDMQNINFHLEVNGETRQEGNTSLMLFQIDYIISFISRFFTLKTGDLIFTGTPKGVGLVKAGDKLTAFIEGKKMLEFEVK